MVKIVQERTAKRHDVNLRFELTRVDDESRVAGGGSSGGWFLSRFGSWGASIEVEAVVASLEDVAIVGY